MSGIRGNERSEPMKVVFINTQYVSTDARSFKTVVQQLTGKDATVAADPSVSSGGGTLANDRGHDGNNGTTQFYDGGDGGCDRRGRGMDQFDRLFREMPPVDELYKLWSDN